VKLCGCFLRPFFSTIVAKKIVEVLFISKNLDRKQDALVNENIRAKEIMLISSEGKNLGKMTPEEGLEIARRYDLDMVCVAPQAPVPVCKLMDYSKYRYEQQRRAKEAKKNQKTVTVKEIWVTPVISQNDLETKVRNARKFLEEGHKVRVTLRIRSKRMLSMGTFNDQVLERVAEMLADYGTVEQQPKLEGRTMTMIMTPRKDKKK